MKTIDNSNDGITYVEDQYVFTHLKNYSQIILTLLSSNFDKLKSKNGEKLQFFLLELQEPESFKTNLTTSNITFKPPIIIELKESKLSAEKVDGFEIISNDDLEDNCETNLKSTVKVEYDEEFMQDHELAYSMFADSNHQSSDINSQLEEFYKGVIKFVKHFQYVFD